LGGTYHLHAKEYTKQDTSTKQAASTALLAPCFMLDSCLGYSSMLKAVCCPETLIDFHRTTQRYVPEDTIHFFTTTTVSTSNPKQQIKYETRISGMI
jgi:hypothetical protein